MNRRSFLKSAGLLAAVSTLPATFQILTSDTVVHTAVYRDASRRSTVTRLSYCLRGTEYGVEVEIGDEEKHETVDVVAAALRKLEMDSPLKSVDYRLEKAA